MSARTETKQALVEKVTRPLVDHPFEHLSLQGIADRCGVSLWVLRSAFRNVEGLFRAVAADLLDKVLVGAHYPDPPGSSVIEAIEHYARFVAGLVAGAQYRDLVYLVLRNGNHHEWLAAAYEQRIVGRICAQLGEVVLGAGRQHGITILLKQDAARQFFKRIETELILSNLLPPHAAPAATDTPRLLKAVAHDTFASTYVFAWEASSAA